MSIQIKWFPRSWIQIKINDIVIYIDPSYMKSYYKNNKNIIKFPDINDDDAELPEVLEKADYILYTHSHKDHCKKITTELLKKSDTILIGPKTCEKEIGKLTHYINPNQKLEFENFKILTIPAYNTEESSSTKKVHKSSKCVGYIIKSECYNIYHAGDTDFIPEMSNVKDIDVAFLPIGGTFTMNIEEAVLSAKAISPQIAVPIHNLNQNPEQFKALLSDTPQIEVKILDIGESIKMY